jgi:hypothetical protein
MTEEVTDTPEDPAGDPAAGGPAASGPAASGPAAGDPVAGDPVAGDPVAGDLGLAAERDRLARLLRETRLQLTMTQARLAALEQSATLELGRTLVRAARRPWPRGAQLPRDLYRMWRTGGASQTAPATSPAMLALASAQLGDLAGGGERLLSALTAPGLTAPGPLPAAAPRLAVTGVLTTRACATLAADAAVHPLLPHDADIGLESGGADLVIIEAAALLAGSAWAFAVDPAGADRGRRLARLIAAARALGKPVIFVRNVPAHLAPGLEWVAASCDAVTDDGLGVPLALFNPIGLLPSRSSRPVYAGVRDPREPPALRALLDSVTGDDGHEAQVNVTGEVRWRGLPALYREHALFVTASAEQAREQRACGARAIMADGDRAGLLSRLAEAAAAGPPGWPDIALALRDIFTEHAAGARLAALATLAGLPDDLIAGRQIAVLACTASADAAQALGASVLRQQLLPAELVVATGPGELVRTASAALSDVAARGVRVQVISPADEAWLRTCAARSRSPWAAPWDTSREYGGTYLLDLACARECSQADAIGYAGAAYAYVPRLTSAGLARRELLGSGTLDLSDGLRLFSVS